MSERQVLIAQLNQALLGVFGHGIHTCIVIVALWATFSSKRCRPENRRVMVFIILLLYIFATIYVASDWVYAIYYSVEKRKEGSSFFHIVSRASKIGLGTINTGVSDGITIWRCWIVWGRRRSFIIPPILLLLAQEVCGCFAFQRAILDNATLPATLYDAITIPAPSLEIVWMMMFLSLSLGTTLWCTTLIIYRILTVKGYTDDGRRPHIYRRIVEILVESASIHAVGLIGCMVLIRLDIIATFYPGSVYVAITAISPTLIVARVASGNARLDDDWQASKGASSLRFRSETRTTGSDLSATIDLEHGGSPMTDGCEHEGDVDIEKGADVPKNMRTNQ
ncbi:hypothetical protein F5146DRAFT_1124932 [Armillaria mellea]|nr:hypothetical protein F5146DRAFT_1124932 [Armillaria mellea]